MVSGAVQPISVVRYSPFHSPDPRRIYIVLEAYFDGCGQSHDSDLLTLAGLAAPESVWPRFEAKWQEVLTRNHLLYWHTSDAMSMRNLDFVEPAWRARWTIQDSIRAKNELLELIFASIRTESINGFQVRSCTVNMADYSAVRSNNKWLRNSEAICVNVVCGGLMLDPSSVSVHLVFDANERFMHEINQVWVKDKNKPEIRWAQQVDAIIHGKSRKTYALQAADLIAWEDTRNCRRHVLFAHASAAIRSKVFVYYDLAKIEGEYTVEREKKRAEGLARAGRITRETRLLDAETNADDEGSTPRH